MGKIKEFLKRLFFKNKKLAIAEEITPKKEVNKNLKEKIKIIDNSKLLRLQEDYENGKIDEMSMSTKQMKELIELYEKQIQELNYQIARRK